MRRLLLLALLLVLGSAACGSSEKAPPQEVWSDFVAAVNDGDVDTVERFLDSEIEWTWDSNLLAIHQRASGRDEALVGIEDLIGRGVTLDSTVIEAADSTLTAETVFYEPDLEVLLGGHTLLQTDVVTVSDGVIVVWVSTADETVQVEDPPGED